MAQNETKKVNAKGYAKSVAYLVEAAFRGFVGYMLLTNFTHNYVAVAAGVYGLVTAAVIVISHFVKAHK